MNVDTQLPKSGPGFVTNNRGDNGEFQFGEKSSIDAALRVGTAWDALHPNHPFSIGQISLEGGGPFSGHASHQVGRERSDPGRRGRPEDLGSAGNYLRTFNDGFEGNSLLRGEKSCLWNSQEMDCLWIKPEFRK